MEVQEGESLEEEEGGSWRGRGVVLCRRCDAMYESMQAWSVENQFKVDMGGNKRSLTAPTVCDIVATYTASIDLEN